MGTPNRNHRGLYPQEKQVMDLWDAGHSIRRIAKRVGIREQRVRNLVIFYDGAADRRTQDAAMRAGSAALLSALQGARA